MYDFLVLIEIKSGREKEIFYRRIKANSIAEANGIATMRYSRSRLNKSGKVIFSSCVLAVYLNVKHIKGDDGNV